jgi:hypothetical protein
VAGPYEIRRTAIAVGERAHGVGAFFRGNSGPEAVADVDRHGEGRAQRRIVERHHRVETWLEVELGRIPGRGGLAEAIRYALTRWSALCRFLDDGRIDLDNNPVERAIRPVALGRNYAQLRIMRSWLRQGATPQGVDARRTAHNLDALEELHQLVGRSIAGEACSDRLQPAEGVLLH